MTHLLDPADPIDRALIAARQHLREVLGDGRVTIASTIEGDVTLEIETAITIAEGEHL